MLKKYCIQNLRNEMKKNLTKVGILATTTALFTASSATPVTAAILPDGTIGTAVGFTLTTNEKLKKAFEDVVGGPAKLYATYRNNEYRVNPEYLMSTVKLMANLQRELSEEQYWKFLAEQSAGLYTDVDESDWFAPYASLFTFTGVIGGYDDGTFRPHDPVSRAEFYTMLALARTNHDPGHQGFQQLTKEIAKTSGIPESTWYLFNFAEVAGSFGWNLMVPPSHTIDEIYFSENLSKGEAASIITVNYDNKLRLKVEKELREGTFTDYPFPDMKGGFEYTDVNIYTEDGVPISYPSWYRTQIKKAVEQNISPDFITTGMVIAKANGIVTGDQNGNSNWTKPLTRAEALIMIYNSIASGVVNWK